MNSVQPTLLEHVLERMPVGVAILDCTNLRILYMNTYLQSLLPSSWPTQSPIGHRLRDIASDEEYKIVEPLIQEVCLTGRKETCCSMECAQQWIESEGHKERHPLITHLEEDDDDLTPPTQVMRSGWIYARRKKGDYPDHTERSGKRLIWLTAETINRYWQKIKEAVERGYLGDAAKVTTAGNETQQGRRVKSN